MMPMLCYVALSNTLAVFKLITKHITISLLFQNMLSKQKSYCVPNCVSISHELVLEDHLCVVIVEGAHLESTHLNFILD
jgi:hypothetical protein